MGLGRIVLLAVLLLAGASDAFAACSVTATGMLFGPYNVFDLTPVDSTATIALKCATKDKNIKITLDRGGNSTFNRVMDSGANHLNYNLYLDATRSNIWGDGTAGTVAYLDSNPANGTVSIPVYGRIPAGQDVSVGAYTDSILVTVHF
ncbi:MAG: spore coat U domain-containing protein [Acidobacteriota bacterium]